MISDSLHYALLSETLEAASPERRRAAGVLLEIARSEEDFGSLHELVVTAEQRFGDQPELRELVDEFGMH
jgi:hypothetical protein